MPVEERFASRKITDSENPSAETVWLVSSTADDPIADEVAAYAALIAHPVPSTYTFPSGKVAELTNIAIADIDQKSWDFTVSYSVFVPKQEDDIEFEFEAGSQSVTLTHANSTTVYTGGGRTAPDFKGGINVSSDGKIQGIAVDRPRFSFTLTKYWAASAIDAAYLVTARSLAGTVNNATFWGFAAGTIRFMGHRGRKVGDKFPVAYMFEFSPNETGITVGDITGISRTGWQYLDIYRMTVADSSAKKNIQVPHSVFIHTVYPPADFSILGL